MTGPRTLSDETDGGLASRRAAIELIEAVTEHGRTLEEAVSGSGRVARLSARDRAFSLALAGESLRRLGSLDHLIDHYLSRPLKPRTARIRQILRLGLCQVLYLAVADHAAVDTSVRLARKAGLGTGMGGLVNAVLRRVIREGETCIRQAEAAPERNIPSWLRQRWTESFGADRVRRIATAHLHQPQLDVTLRDPSESAAWADRLAARPLPTGSLRLPGERRVDQLPGFGDGAWWVQDAAAAIPARLLGDVRGLRVADLCAAPGGKTMQLAAAGASVIALDRSPERMARLRRNLERTGLEADCVTADALAWEPDRPLDSILLDAPCLATGTARRHPDALWIKTPDMLKSLMTLQARLLDHAAGLIRPGGCLLYCVCSLETGEGAGQISAFLERHAEFRSDPIDPAEVGGLAELIDDDGHLRTLPCHLADSGGMDGFFAARLRRGDAAAERSPLQQF